MTTTKKVKHQSLIHRQPETEECAKQGRPHKQGPLKNPQTASLASIEKSLTANPFCCLFSMNYSQLLEIILKQLFGCWFLPVTPASTLTLGTARLEESCCSQVEFDRRCALCSASVPIQHSIANPPPLYCHCQDRNQIRNATTGSHNGLEAAIINNLVLLQICWC